MCLRLELTYGKCQGNLTVSPCGIVSKPLLFSSWESKSTHSTTVSAVRILTREVRPGTTKHSHYSVRRSSRLLLSTAQETRWNTEYRRKPECISVWRPLGTQIAHKTKLPPLFGKRFKGFCDRNSSSSAAVPWSGSGPHQLQETQKGGYREAP